MWIIVLSVIRCYQFKRPPTDLKSHEILNCIFVIPDSVPLRAVEAATFLAFKFLFFKFIIVYVYVCCNYVYIERERGVGNDWNFVGHHWDYFWKMRYGLKMLLFHSYFERWKLNINKCNDRLRKFTETSLTLKITVKIYLNYEILWTEIWNMSPKIFQKVEIWALIFLSLKFRRRFLIVSYSLRERERGCIWKCV